MSFFKQNYSLVLVRRYFSNLISSFVSVRKEFSTGVALPPRIGARGLLYCDFRSCYCSRSIIKQVNPFCSHLKRLVHQDFSLCFRSRELPKQNCLLVSVWEGFSTAITSLVFIREDSSSTTNLLVLVREDLPNQLTFLVLIRVDFSRELNPFVFVRRRFSDWEIALVSWQKT